MSDLTELGKGAALGVLLTFIGNLVAEVLKSRTTLKTGEIDQQGKFTRDLMDQLERTLQENGELVESAKIGQRKEMVFVRLLANVGGEMRVLRSLTVSLQEDAGTGDTTPEEVGRRTGKIIETIDSIQRIVDSEKHYLAVEISAKRNDDNAK